MRARVTYVEVPVTDIHRAAAFYTNVFDVTSRHTVIDGHPACLLDDTAEAEGAVIALMQGASYVPSVDGIRVYISVPSVEGALARAIENGSRELYPPTKLADGQVVAEFSDSEGNRIAVSDM
ncbi:VOC family protein [Mycobacterium sp. NPDC050853]|uniref:VOC family protein n=1 Tax=Mycobacteriaceae TaxID=1762 RepID=UPI002106C4F7